MLLMADSPISRDSGQAAPDANGSKAPVVVPELVLPAAAAPSDDTPTVISKSIPGLNHSITLSEGLSLRGRSLAHFELLEPIGVGGMAAVLRARDKQLDRFVALKILPPEMAVDPENIRRFHQEARAAAKLDHENIARVFFCGEDQNLHFISFEYVEGENLRTILERRGRLPVPEAVRYMLQIAAGLEHAASRGVVHRDIKPSNIIVTPTGRAKLVDMGLARSLEAHSDMALTQSGVTLGTFDYISPEQALEPREADSRSDIYSLGCTFYHVLTGHTPVPEGTAAKKLVHHRDIAPLDPRQLNPEIPDEVAAVLARMMAKDPKDRYQRPVHLVQHLMQVAQHVGAAVDVPEGVMFIDAPLPNAPRKRPVLMIALATVFLAGLLFVQSLTPTGPGPNPPLNGPAPKGHQLDPVGKEVLPNEPPNGQPVEGGPYRLPKDLDSLRDAMATGASTQVNVVVDGVTDLTDGPLVFRGKRRVLTVTGEKDGVFVLKYEPKVEEEAALRAGILIDDEGEANFTNVRFELRAKLTPEIPVTGVMLKGSGKLTFVKCTFTQKDYNPEQPLIPWRDRIPLASVAVQNPSLIPPEKLRVTFKECYFQTGQDAVALEGAAHIIADNCTFGPHGAFFHLRGDKKPESRIQLEDCSAFVVYGPAFRLDEQARCEVIVKNSIVSCPEPSLSFDDQALLLQTDDGDSPHVRYFGTRNRYHNLNLFWGWKAEKKAGAKVINWNNFKAEVAKAGGRESTDQPSLFLDGKQNPWLSANPLKETDPIKMFSVSHTLPELRRGPLTALGVISCVWGPMGPLSKLEATLVAGQALQANEKLVDPDASGDKPGIYDTFAKALVNARSDDVILIKHPKDSREVEVGPALLESKIARLTVKPYPGYQPVLTLAEKPGELDAVMFKLYDSELRLENLEILLKSTRYKSQAAVALFGDGKCDFSKCVFTMKDTKDSRVVIFGDPGQIMKMPSKTGRQMPEVYFKDCFIRGEGELVRYQVSRPAKVDMENSLVALAGPFASINANPKEPPVDPAGVLRLKSVSTFLTGSLVKLKGDEVAKFFAKTNVDATKCLFAALAGKPLIRLDKLDFDQEQLSVYLPWIGKEPNAYTGYNKMVDQPDGMMGRLRDWQPEPDARMLTVKFKLPSLSERPLSQAVLDDFLPMQFQMDLQGYGASLQAADLPPLDAPTTEPAADKP
jgi:serine/threonine protein kinase